MSLLDHSRRLGIALCLSVAGTSAAAQTTWYVDVQGVPPGLGTQAEPYTSIQYAITQPSTVSGDTVLVAPGEYVENVDTGQKNLTLRSSEGPLVTTIRPAQIGSGVILRSYSDLEGFTVTGATATDFLAAVHVKDSDSDIRRCIVRDNVGNGIGNSGDIVRITHCTITGNDIGIHSFFQGGVYVSGHSSIASLNGIDIKDGNGSGSHLDSSVVGAADPGFWNYDERDLRLRPGSPAIDAGSLLAPPDPDGSVSDAGALVYDPTYAPGPSVYCTGKLSSQGCTPAIGAIGSASASAPAPFIVTASQEVPGMPGLLFFGFGPREAPFQGGLHCVEPPTPRVGGQFSAGSGPCGGTFAFDMGNYIQSGANPGLLPGALVYCQWWNRDPLDPAGFGTGLTNALYFGIAP